MDADRSGGATEPSLRMLLVADTHVPLRARRLPDELLRATERADVVVHAGDWVDLSTLELLEGRARRLVGVYGNNDGPELRARLPEVARVRLGGLEFGVVHETGAARGREARCAALHPELDVLVFGHSHIPWDSVAPGGLRLLNPGSPTDRRRQPYCTYMTCTVADGVLGEVDLHRLPRR
ncbi:metallophosphoesterase family protein [Streptomyces sp. NPDC058629]|uniref:metallophosphoesterase family protein n=1 Tax=Streptomyces sp. NPDC058629 TaxID=3346565 RepID=UPI0036620853